MRVFISGASSGLGEAFARYYDARGAQLGLFARSGDKLQALSASLSKPASCYAGDVRCGADLHKAAADFLQDGPVDIVIASAGISVGILNGMVEDADVFREIIETNVLGLGATFEPFIPGMQSRGSGTLVGISSVAGVRGLPGSSAYSASKAAVTVFMESLRIDLYGTGVKVVTIAPGFIDTPMTRQNPYPMPFLMQPDAFAQKAGQAITLGRRYTVIPWQMGLVARLLRFVPSALYDRVMSRSGRKPRRH
ncbi:SDR family oxidoreductase [Advenella mimigardefordensis]|uniref:Putative oxidoreductase, SDR family n=1 Tax=Advenella mimigardefordensis (strain DSM 17166 / LMG 22922 / DPN7) TaxID=1247726 RepID=W0PD49_ADVMD|nr:SDR family oxidoreductase [Advenella mimigardefordensis]AHG64676.1 putative oxidoreductase, SDR family [Advenella mimigardefordensis DPN7]